MVKQFATGMHESWLYNPTTSTELSIFLIIFPLIPNPFHLYPVLVLWSLYTNLRYGYTREVVASSEWSYDMISSAISMKLGILWIDPDRVIFQKSVVRILYGYSIFSVISFRVIDAWYSEFSIIGLLYYAQDYQGFLYLRYSGSFIAQPRHQQYYSALF